MEKLKLSLVVPDKNQPRKYFAAEKLGALKESIKVHGIVNPIIVQKEGDSYLIVDGERRFRVASDLGFKEVPVAIISAKDPITRLVEQFHIQEMHEGWSTIEKASVLIRLAQESNKSIAEVCKLLNLSVRTANRYLVFSKLSDTVQNKMTENQMGIEHAEGIDRLKKAVKRIKEEDLSEAFTQSDARHLEKVCIDAIKDGELSKPTDYSHLKDSFTMNPKLINKFLEGKQSISEMFVKSNAKTAYHLRNMIANAGFMKGHGFSFLKNPDVKLRTQDAVILRDAVKIIKQVLELSGAED